MSIKYFYDLPVYRLPEERYYRARDAHIDRILFPSNYPSSKTLRLIEKDQPNINSGMRGHLETSYGGCWKFNEIVGYIRLHFLGTQVRGEFYGLNRKRLVRTRTRTLELRSWTLADEVEILDPITSDSILTAVKQYITNCRRKLPKRFIDVASFEALSNHVDWHALFIEK